MKYYIEQGVDWKDVFNMMKLLLIPFVIFLLMAYTITFDIRSDSFFNNIPISYYLILIIAYIFQLWRAYNNHVKAQKQFILTIDGDKIVIEQMGKISFEIDMNGIRVATHMKNGDLELRKPTDIHDRENNQIYRLPVGRITRGEEIIQFTSQYTEVELEVDRASLPMKTKILMGIILTISLGIFFGFFISKQPYYILIVGSIFMLLIYRRFKARKQTKGEEVRPAHLFGGNFLTGFIALTIVVKMAYTIFILLQ